MLLKDLVISPYNVRDSKTVEEGIEELAESIKDNTLISRIIIRRNKTNKFEIVAGMRRYKALMALLGEDAELPTEDYILREDLDDEHAYLLSIDENTYRKPLTPIELNRAILKLNGWGYKDKEIAKRLNITPHRLKRLSTLGEDLHHMPEAAKAELSKPVEEAKLNDAHWDKIREIENEDIVKDVVDYIIEKEVPPRDVPTVVKAVEKNYEKENPLPSEGASSKAPEESDAPPAEGPIEYSHKGELKLEIQGGNQILRVLGKDEDQEVPLEHYLEYLRHPEQFRCFVTFKLKIKPVE